MEPCPRKLGRNGRGTYKSEFADVVFMLRPGAEELRDVAPNMADGSRRNVRDNGLRAPCVVVLDCCVKY